jgi:hypothetical protein
MMSYQDAMRQFQENVNLTNNINDPLTWNLNAGLGNIAESLSYDLTEIKSQLTAILQRLSQLESR